MEYILIGLIAAIIGAFIGVMALAIARMSNPHKKLYKREDLIRAQEIYHENFNEEPDVFKPVYTKAGAAYHMDYILGIIDSKSYKMKIEYQEPTPEKLKKSG